ncbi:iron-containing alcohol dehydrogenase [Anaerocolumna jejuensis]|uniref:iron-containing alcohol dehydrogenase n=1 Tax=Anaerocolumna jejuensis TaxID=259063 RepID=UPI003F7B3C05
MAYQFTLPRNVFIGKNALEASEAAIKGLGRKAFVVTGRIVTKAGIAATLTGYLEAWGIEYVVFNDITGEPTDQMIEAGVKAFKQTGCDFLIAIGGGSPLDSAKAIAAMTVLPGKISEYLGKDITGKFPPMVLIPTTAGTGSEATKFTVITDSEKGIKMLLKGDALLPDLAVIDPTFTLTSPPDITAATGMDALTHAVEAYTSRKSNPLTELYALSAVKRIFKYLPTAYSKGSDEKAREEMQIAAFEAGVSINNASVTLVHGMSRPIGALFHVPHGISNAMLIKECLAFALDGCYERFGTLARAIGAADENTGDEEAAGAFLTELAKLCKHCNIPTLEEYGINKSEFDAAADKMAQDAIASGSPSNTVKEVLKEDLLKIYAKLW